MAMYETILISRNVSRMGQVLLYVGDSILYQYSDTANVDMVFATIAIDSLSEPLTPYLGSILSLLWSTTIEDLN